MGPTSEDAIGLFGVSDDLSDDPLGEQGGDVEVVTRAQPELRLCHGDATVWEGLKRWEFSGGSTTIIISPFATWRSVPSEGTFRTLPCTHIVDDPPPSWLMPHLAPSVSRQKRPSSSMVMPMLRPGSRPSTTTKKIQSSLKHTAVRGFRAVAPRSVKVRMSPSSRKSKLPPTPA